ncbi:exonuclease SbcCD subunit D [Allofustis seminis]|uniref:exonuclease SbcCD subunit D n=1 Tax=Allofustis seminis TaxID=166939 RepID=UPI0003660947|nr:exonuclease SbcCD subunit D [Allofustis seminis]
MRLLHTADWHLGKIVNEFSMLPLQMQYLEQLKTYLAHHPVDAMIMAGDLYDRAVPAKEAVQLANDFFTYVTQELGIALFIIAGNHDSNERLEYGADLFAHSQLFIEGTLKRHVRKVAWRGANFYLIPYADPREVAAVLEDDMIKTPEDAIRAQIQTIKAEDWDPKALNILIYHGFVVPDPDHLPEESDSERPLSIGTIEYVPAALFKDFDYVALGHLHKAQRVGSENIRYSGSPIKYSKSEAHHRKQNLLIDLTKDTLKVKSLDITVPLDLRIIRGTFKELMKEQSDDFLFIELEDMHYITDAMRRLRQNYPNTMALEYIYQTSRDQLQMHHSKEKLEKLSLAQLFSEFYESFVEVPLEPDQEMIIHKMLNEINEEEKA